MDDQQATLRHLSDEECWTRLRGELLGRLVTHVGDVVDIAPVNYVVDGATLVFRTAEGQKLAGLTVNHDVVFEIDAYDDATGWSVVARGTARHVTSPDEIQRCDELDLKPMAPTLKFNYVRIDVSSVSGREFNRGPEVDRETVQPG